MGSKGTSKCEVKTSKSASTGKIVILTPSDNNQLTEGSFYACMQDIDRALCAQQPFLLIMFQETLLTTNELPSDLPSQVKLILQEYEDVFPEELPKRLSPL